MHAHGELVRMVRPIGACGGGNSRLSLFPLAYGDGMKSDSSSCTKRPRDDTELQLSDPAAGPRQKRAKTTKACNACRKQKSRCERLAGDSEGCHRCGVIGVSCVFESDGLSVDSAKFWKPRPILPRNRNGDEHKLPQT